MKKMTSLKIEEALWADVKLAARSWAARLGFRPEGKTTEWLEHVLRRAADQELGREGS